MSSEVRRKISQNMHFKRWHVRQNGPRSQHHESHSAQGVLHDNEVATKRGIAH